MQASKDMDIQKKDISGNTDSGRKKSGTHKIWRHPVRLRFAGWQRDGV